MISYECIGAIQFLEDGSLFSIYYKEEEYQIVLGVPETGEIWDKGKKFTVSVLFKSRFYNIQIIKVMKTVRHHSKN